MPKTAPFPVAFNGPVDRFVVTSHVFGRQIFVITQSGDVWGHEITGNNIGPGFKLGGAKVAFNGPVDRFVVVKDDRMFVITQSGDVWGHEFTGNNVGPGIKLGGAKVAFNGPVDRFVVASGLMNHDRIYVFTQSGDVWGHEITGNNVGPGIKLGGAKVAFNGPVDRFVVTMGTRIIVVTQSGDVWGHEIDQGGTGNTIKPGFKFGGAKVAFNGPVDRFVVTSDNRIVVIREDGDVWGHEITGNTIGPGFPMNFRLLHFTFANDISVANRNRTIDRHRFVLRRILGCNNLSAEEKRRLLDVAYDRAIHHTTLNEPGVNASAPLNGTQVNINFGVLFPQGDEEISQTLIHEMMHIAGFTHPARRDPPAGTPCAAPFDCPGDNGVYYGTPPLRAEFCIAGDQSDVRSRLETKALHESCVIDEQGVATLYTDAGSWSSDSKGGPFVTADTPGDSASSTTKD
ncbi:hypothetical protein [Nonomuraea roseola]|uniref:Uncharacterized protein n=1 Tax=Nonomuraea roseola TaxID=46179 RepID=A0ABV5Q585_9ACTN